MLKSPLTLGFLVILLALSLVDLFTPTKVFSEYENRRLAQRPEWSLEKVIDGTFMHDFETYVNDQFVLRNDWIRLKAVSEHLLLKRENKGIFFGREGYLFDKVFTAPPTTTRNLRYLQEFLELYAKEDITCVIVPNSFAILTQHRPRGVPFLDQVSLLAVWEEEFGLLNLAPLFLAHQDKPIYYRSDHHWTLYGAYLAYEAIVQSWGLEAVPYEDFDVHEVEGFLGTYYRRARPVLYRSETLQYLDPSIHAYHYFGQVHQSLIDQDAFNTLDQYRALMHGNIGYANIFMVEEAAVESKILIIKDSYANAMIPFLTHHVDQIDVVDLRHFNGSLKALIETGDYDHILFLQNFMHFTQDPTVARLRY